jgi:HD-like signal output (HDOD) protein
MQDDLDEGSVVTPTPLAPLEEFVASVEHLPLFAGIAAQLIKSVDDESMTASELARQVSTDAALVAQLLRLVNSPYYGLRRGVATVSDAIAVLGLNLVRRVVIAAVLQRPLFAYLPDTRVARDFWRHQLFCALLARHLHQHKRLNGEVAYMAGMLHDVGRLVMLLKYPLEIDAMLDDRSIEDDTALERERARFGFDHAVVGAALLELWDVPTQMVVCAGRHAEVTEPDDALAASVWRANLLAHQLFDAGAAPFDEANFADVAITVAIRKQILEEVAAFEGASG